ncbi:MAG: hypothetical protein ACR2LR_03295 [Hassallia sp.]
MKYEQLPLFFVQPDPRVAVYDASWDELEITSQSVVTVLEQDTLTTVPEQKSPESEPSAELLQHIDHVLERDTSVLEYCHWVETYSPSNRKDNKYYRYCWKIKGKICHCHIPGGNVRSSTAMKRKEIVIQAIADGESPQEIKQLIRGVRS